MSGYLGLLCCGGRGTRLGEITRYVSKALVPVYDRPAFRFGLAALEASTRINDIVLLTNQYNDATLATIGLKTVIQEDAVVRDMFSGLAFVRRITRDDRPAVVMPCDNISSISVDPVIDIFEQSNAEITINLRHIDDPAVLGQIGVFDPTTETMEYRPAGRTVGYGVLAPYVIRQDLDLGGGDAEVVNRHRVSWRVHDGPWFDIGTPDELLAASNFVSHHRAINPEANPDGRKD